MLNNAHSQVLECGQCSEREWVLGGQPLIIRKSPSFQTALQEEGSPQIAHTEAAWKPPSGSPQLCSDFLASRRVSIYSLSKRY